MFNVSERMIQTVKAIERVGGGLGNGVLMRLTHF